MMVDLVLVGMMASSPEDRISFTFETASLDLNDIQSLKCQCRVISRN